MVAGDALFGSRRVQIVTLAGRDRIPTSFAGRDNVAAGGPQAPQAQASSAEFAAFLQTSGSGAANLNQEQREELLRKFLRWQESQRNARSR